MLKKHILWIALGAALLLTAQTAKTQGVAINTSVAAADPSAMLDVSSTSKGMLVPRMTNSELDSINLPATGLLVYQTNGTPGFYYNSGVPASPIWTAISGGATGTAGGDLTGSYPNPIIDSGVISNSSINAAAAIAYSKLDLGNSIVNSDVSTSAAIAYSKLNLSNSIMATDLTTKSVTIPKIKATGTPSASTYLRGDSTWSTPVNEIFYGNFQAPTAGTSTTYFFPICGGGVPNSSIFGTSASYSPVACTFDAIYINGAETFSASASSYTVTLYVNGSATILTATISLPATLNTAVESSLTGKFVSVAVGDAIAIGCSTTNVTPTSHINVSLHCK